MDTTLQFESKIAFARARVGESSFVWTARTTLATCPEVALAKA